MWGIFRSETLLNVLFIFDLLKISLELPFLKSEIVIGISGVKNLRPNTSL